MNRTERQPGPLQRTAAECLPSICRMSGEHSDGDLVVCEIAMATTKPDDGKQTKSGGQTSVAKFKPTFSHRSVY